MSQIPFPKLIGVVAFFIATFSLACLTFIGLFPFEDVYPSEKIFASSSKVEIWKDNNSDKYFEESFTNVDYVGIISAPRFAEEFPIVTSVVNSNSSHREQADFGSIYLDKENLLTVAADTNIGFYRMQPGEKVLLGYHIRKDRFWIEVNGKIAYTNGANQLSYNPEAIILWPLGDKLSASNIEISQVREPLGNIRPAVLSVLSLSAFAAISVLVIIFATKISKPIVQTKGQSAAVKIISSIIAAGTLIVFLGNLLGFVPFPFNPPGVRFSDFYQIIIFGQSNPFGQVQSNYPLFALLTAQLGRSIPENILFSYVFIFSFATIVGVLAVAAKTSKKWTGYIPGAVIGLCYPLLFALDRGNLEVVVVALIVLSCLFWNSGKQVQAGALFGIAIALKIYPVLLLIPLIPIKIFRKGILISLLVAAAAMFVSSIYFGLNMREIAQSIAGTGSTSLIPISQKESWSYSLSSLILLLNDISGSSFEQLTNLNIWLSGKTFLFLTTASMLLIAIWSTLVEKIVWKKLALVSAGLLLFTGVAFQYRGAILLIPILAFLYDRNTKNHYSFVSICFGLLLAPIGFISIGSSETSTLATLIQPSILLAIIIWLITTNQSFKIIFRDFTPRQIARNISFSRNFSISLMFLGLILIASSLYSLGGSSTIRWSANDTNNQSPVGKAITGLGGASSLVGIPPITRPISINFLSVGGQVQCTGIKINIFSNKINIHVNASPKTSEQSIQIFGDFTKDNYLSFNANGRSVILLSNGKQTEFAFKEPTCFDLAKPQIFGLNSNSAPLSFKWEKNSGPTYEIGVAGIASLFFGALILLKKPTSKYLNRQNNG